MVDVNRPRIVQVVAVALNRVIGAQGRIPWRVPSDLKTFRRLTIGKPIVMGRRTFDSIGKPLDKRLNIVITRRAAIEVPGVIAVPSVDAAISAAGKEIDEIVIIGGGEIYRATRPITDRIYLTRIDAAPEGDAIFDPLNSDEWVLVESSMIDPDPRDECGATLEVYDRVA